MLAAEPRAQSTGVMIALIELWPAVAVACLKLTAGVRCSGEADFVVLMRGE